MFVVLSPLLIDEMGFRSLAMLLLTSIGAKETIFTTTSSLSPRKALGGSLNTATGQTISAESLGRKYKRQCDAWERCPTDAESNNSCICYLHKLPASSSFFSAVQIAMDTAGNWHSLLSNDDNACTSPLADFLGPRREISPTRLVLITAFLLHEIIL
jgi:hypothetical protein